MHDPSGPRPPPPTTAPPAGTPPVVPKLSLQAAGRGTGRTVPAWTGEQDRVPGLAQEGRSGGAEGWQQFFDPATQRVWQWNEREGEVRVDGALQETPTDPEAVAAWRKDGWDAYLDPATKRVWWYHPQHQQYHLPWRPTPSGASAVAASIPVANPVAAVATWEVPSMPGFARPVEVDDDPWKALPAAKADPWAMGKDPW
eukprot:CAMPEP_0171066122 /NCGR_PEP_ID=MMETSP0766_2-20121228/7243_1 /TAXON_ID=439317 /ORGANISM="Gambierdiscus australes, Strain CAWD 149" /LENGTH=198 /DNA_ID=CAMNT_0011522277 /DNA_START=55 /DNA_END=648 /DNA_ORIENTATION=-